MRTSSCLSETRGAILLLLEALIGHRDDPLVTAVLLRGSSGAGKSWLITEAMRSVQRRVEHQTEQISSSGALVANAPRRTVVDAVESLAVSALDVFSPVRKQKQPEAANEAPVGSGFSRVVEESRKHLVSQMYSFSKNESAVDSSSKTLSTGTLVVVMENFAMFLASSASSLQSHSDGVVDDSENVEGSSTVSLLFPEFAVEFLRWARPSPSLPAEAGGDASPRIRLVFVVTETQPSSAALHPLLLKKLFHFVLHVPLPEEAERAAFVACHIPRFLNAAKTSSSSRSADSLLRWEAGEAETLVTTLSQHLASRTGGLTFTGIEEVVHEASRRFVQHLERCEDVSTSHVNAEPDRIKKSGLLVCASGLCDEAIKVFFSSSSTLQAKLARERTGFVDVAKTRWSDIAGLHEAKRLLQQLVVAPVQQREIFRRFDVRPSFGVVLYGPPGTGKTMLARAMATELSASFLFLDLPQLIHSEVGESERTLREFFATAKTRSPSVMFIDELQSAFASRSVVHGEGLGQQAVSSHDSRLVSSFLALLDEAQRDDEHLVVFVGATNVIECLDPLLLRAGRLDTHIYIGNPDEDARRALIASVVKGSWATWWLPQANEQSSTTDIQDRLVCAFTEKSAGMSGAELRHALNVFALSLVSFIGQRVGDTIEVPALVGKTDGASLSLHLRRLLTDESARGNNGARWTWTDACCSAFRLAFPLTSGKNSIVD